MLFCAVLAGLALILMPRVASTNTVSSWKSGELIGEPIGRFRQFAISSETLFFDLRPLEMLQQARVVASYRLRNNGRKAVIKRLLFIVPGSSRQSQRVLSADSVILNGEALSFKPTTLTTLPSQWKPPTTLPNIGAFKPGAQGEKARWSSPTSDSGYNAVIVWTSLQPGENQLQVKYALKPSEYHSNEIFPYYQIGYVLAPARLWGSFGQLSIKMALPTGWDVATSLSMRRMDDTLQATFKGIPADSLEITLRRPLDVVKSSFLHYIEWFLKIGWFVSAIGGSVLFAWSTERLAHSRSWKYEKLFVLFANFMMRNGLSTAALLFVLTLMHQQWRIESLEPLKPYLSDSWIFVNLRMDYSIAFLFAVFGFLSGSITTLLALLFSRRWRQL